MTLQKIVVGVDFSASTEAACNQALAIARHTGADVVLAHATALPDAPEGLPASMHATADAYMRLLRDRAAAAQRDLAALGDRLRGQGAEISQLLLDGFPDDALDAAADKLDAGLIVIGACGRRGLAGLVGGTAGRIVRAATRPVLVARGAVNTYRKVCVATDFSAVADRTVDLALALVGSDAELDLLHFCEDSRDLGMTIREALARHATARGSATVAARPRLRYHQREGDPTDGIAAWAADTGCDLIVIGSHGRRGVRRLVLGSVAEATVRHASCSVLVVH